jgi:hypothetical protein
MLSEGGRALRRLKETVSQDKVYYIKIRMVKAVLF